MPATLFSHDQGFAVPWDHWLLLSRHVVPVCAYRPLDCLEGVWEWQQFADPLWRSVFWCGFSCLCHILLGIVTANHSWVDGWWSVGPVIYAWLLVGGSWSWPWQANTDNAPDDIPGRAVIMSVLISFWGARLSYNFYRKGGYLPTEEDYRWAHLRRLFPAGGLGAVGWQTFHVLFICLFQNWLLWLLPLPVYWCTLPKHRTPLNGLDAACSTLFLMSLVLETIADEQQWRFQKLKRAGKVGKEQFLRQGLFRYCRHPNFFAEQVLWILIYCFTLIPGGPVINITLLGPVVLIVLFHFSTNFTEAISLSKYSNYAKYQRSTSRLIPWFPGSTPKPLRSRSNTAQDQNQSNVLPNDSESPASTPGSSPSMPLGRSAATRLRSRPRGRSRTRRRSSALS